MNASAKSALPATNQRIATCGALQAITCGHFVHLVERPPEGTYVTAKEGAILEHAGEVFAVAFSPDGKTIASGSIDATVILRDATSKQRKQVLWGKTTTSYVFCVAFSPDGKTIASGYSDNTIILWDVAIGYKKQTLTGHTNYVHSLAFSPDGTTIASASYDRTIILWDATSGQKKRTLKGHRNTVYSVAFSPDGKTIASGSADNTIILWDATSGQKKQTLTAHTDYVWSVTFSPDGTTIASLSARVVALWDAASGRMKQTLLGHTNGATCISFSPDGATIATGSHDKTIILWEVASGKMKQTLTGHLDSVQSIAFSPDGNTIVSGSVDESVRLWVAASEQKEKRILEGHTNLVLCVAFSPDGAAIVSGSLDKTVILWDVASAKPLAKFGPFSHPVESVSLEGSFLVVAFPGGSSHRINVSPGPAKYTPDLSNVAQAYRNTEVAELGRPLPRCERHFSRPFEMWCLQCKEFCCANCVLKDYPSPDALHRSHRLLDLSDPEEVDRKLRPLQREVLSAIRKDCDTLLEESFVLGLSMHSFFEEQLLLAHDRYAEALLSLSATMMELRRSSAAMLPTEAIRATLEKQAKSTSRTAILPSD
jgi:WD40 repeat protein